MTKYSWSPDAVVLPPQTTCQTQQGTSKQLPRRTFGEGCALRRNTGQHHHHRGGCICAGRRAMGCCRPGFERAVARAATRVSVQAMTHTPADAGGQVEGGRGSCWTDDLICQVCLFCKVRNCCCALLMLLRPKTSRCDPPPHKKGLSLHYPSCLFRPLSSSITVTCDR